MEDKKIEKYLKEQIPNIHDVMGEPTIEKKFLDQFRNILKDYREEIKKVEKWANPVLIGNYIAPLILSAIESSFDKKESMMIKKVLKQGGRLLK